MFTFLVAFGNITDYGANFAFAQHVLSMDTTFPDTAPRWRAITGPMLWHAAYWVIILGEALTCVAYTIGTVSLARNLSGSSAAFNRAKSAVYVASALGFLVWFLGFMMIGGEWFAMWQSNTWNGQEAAFRFYAAILCVGIFIALDEGSQPANSAFGRDRQQGPSARRIFPRTTWQRHRPGKRAELRPSPCFWKA